MTLSWGDDDRYGAFKQMGLECNKKLKDAYVFRAIILGDGDPILVYCQTHSKLLLCLQKIFEVFPCRRVSLNPLWKKVTAVYRWLWGKAERSGSAVEKLLICFRQLMAWRCKRVWKREYFVSVISAFLCDMWRTGDWSQSVKHWWNSVFSKR